MIDNFIPNRGAEKTRDELLTEMAGLPASAFVSTAHAAAYLGSTPGVMLNWRSQRKGPRYHGSGNFVRYRISDLDMWMSSRADEVRVDARSHQRAQQVKKVGYEIYQENS
jgi:hypothetical protein